MRALILLFVAALQSVPAAATETSNSQAPLAALVHAILEGDRTTAAAQISWISELAAEEAGVSGRWALVDRLLGCAGIIDPRTNRTNVFTFRYATWECPGGTYAIEFADWGNVPVLNVMSIKSNQHVDELITARELLEAGELRTPNGTPPPIRTREMTAREIALETTNGSQFFAAVTARSLDPIGDLIRSDTVFTLSTSSSSRPYQVDMQGRGAATGQLLLDWIHQNLGAPEAQICRRTVCEYTFVQPDHTLEVLITSGANGIDRVRFEYTPSGLFTGLGSSD